MPSSTPTGSQGATNRNKRLPATYTKLADDFRVEAESEIHHRDDRNNGPLSLGLFGQTLVTEPDGLPTPLMSTSRRVSSCNAAFSKCCVKIRTRAASSPSPQDAALQRDVPPTFMCTVDPTRRKPRFNLCHLGIVSPRLIFSLAPGAPGNGYKRRREGGKKILKGIGSNRERGRDKLRIRKDGSQTTRVKGKDGRRVTEREKKRETKRQRHREMGCSRSNEELQRRRKSMGFHPLPHPPSKRGAMVATETQSVAQAQLSQHAAFRDGQPKHSRLATAPELAFMGTAKIPGVAQSTVGAPQSHRVHGRVALLSLHANTRGLRFLSPPTQVATDTHSSGVIPCSLSDMSLVLLNHPVHHLLRETNTDAQPSVARS
ncbi:hypothetical protein JZ751_013676 [Albula glossodonta]|uniref:Uncharacterized protein n=1 Tax=Albula glossodonta TaxID=121402 RepID=A0A8T2NW47_9TELE|nr:hypothetical protein JZ751_013676 [Albula glossodonta]